MRRIKKTLGLLAGLLVLVVAGGYLYAVVVPPTLLRVGAGYSSKITCSSVFVSGRDPAEVLTVDVQAPGSPLLKAFSTATDGAEGLVEAAFLQFIAPMASVERPGLGCAAVPDGDLAGARAFAADPAPGPSESTALWPEGEGIDIAGQEALAAILADDALVGAGMRSVVVVKDGRIVAERYTDGFGAATPLLGWSMTKTVTAALVGTVIDAGKLSLDQSGLLPQWQGDERAGITVADLMSMSSGLVFNEDYGDVSDVTRMLYLEPDMAAFAAGQSLAHAPGSTFNYSTGTSVILARIWQDAVGQEASLNWPREALFGPLGMGSAVLEADASGTFVGGSYLYATPRDWARFGQMLLQNGRWNGQQVLSWQMARLIQTPSAADDSYTDGMAWARGPMGEGDVDQDALYGVPEDAFWLLGHDGQSMAVIPSAGLVVVRMGLTPSALDYSPQPLVAALAEAAAAK